MSTNRMKILLCTGVSSDTDNENQYKKCLLENNYECDILQVLHYEFINLNELRKHLVDSNSYSGLILSSPRAATAITRARMQNPFPINDWIKRPTFCVGKATEFVAKEQIGLTNILGSHSGNAKNLATFIIDLMQTNYRKPLLHPCSDIARDTIPNMLSEKGMCVTKVIVYKTKAHECLKETLITALNQSPHILVIFSPSIIDNMVAALNNDKSVFEKLKIIAIGPVTEQAVLQHGINIAGVAEKPDPKAVKEIIHRINLC
ncbi:uroporphyrinogen-III synthase-like [Phymastichus coffea]|uniref:uroporphyrinogen-III synthase-like n=1 Tax=Phymastichus coffea TaxID=108790 RepID=UPI00273C4B83|nr:uroporphyrinogen-III synthase-like [Phymastichus coffea]